MHARFPPFLLGLKRLPSASWPSIADAFRMDRNAKPRPDATGRACLIYAVLLGLIVCGARLQMLRHAGVQVPFMDSYAELWLNKAAAQNHFGTVLRISLAPNMEHRVFFTRWLTVGLFLLNGKVWDPLADAVCVSLLSGAIVAFLGFAFGRGLSWGQRAALAAVLLLCFVPGYAYENILWGFQTQHYLFTLFSLGAIFGLVQPAPWSRRGGLGLCCAGAACLCVGSGFFAGLAVMAGVGLLTWRGETRLWDAGRVLGICGLIVLANVLTVPRLPGGEVYRAPSFGAFVMVFLRHLAWPNVTPHDFWLGLLMPVPLGWYLFLSLRRRAPLSRTARALIALTVWTFLISLAVSYLRGSYAPNSRYYDYTCFHVILSGIALIELWRGRDELGVSVRRYEAVAAAWVMAVTIGAVHLADRELRWGLLGRHADLLAEQRAVVEYQRTGDAAVLSDPALHGLHPFTPTASGKLAKALDDPKIRALLPNPMLPEPDQRHRAGPISRVRACLLRVAGPLLAVSATAFLLFVGWQLWAAFPSTFGPDAAMAKAAWRNLWWRPSGCMRSKRPSATWPYFTLSALWSGSAWAVCSGRPATEFSARPAVWGMDRRCPGPLSSGFARCARTPRRTPCLERFGPPRTSVRSFSSGSRLPPDRAVFGIGF